MGPSWSLPRPLVNVGGELDSREVNPMPWTAEDAERHTWFAVQEFDLRRLDEGIDGERRSSLALAPCAVTTMHK